MADKLNQMYSDWTASHTGVTEFEVFQAGFTMAAVSMRERAMKVVDTARPKDGDKHQLFANAVKNGIGSLPDIPE